MDLHQKIRILRRRKKRCSVKRRRRVGKVGIGDYLPPTFWVFFCWISVDGEFWGSRLTTCILATKFLATILIFISMGFLDYFMGLGPMYGWTITKDILQGRQWQESGSFPRVTFCDFQVRELGYVNNWSLQCVLMVNIRNFNSWKRTKNEILLFLVSTRHNWRGVRVSYVGLMNDLRDLRELRKFRRRVLKLIFE